MNQQLVKKLQKLQKEMVEEQQALESSVFTATAGGVVKVEVYGTKELANIEIDKGFEVEGPEDLEMLKDMILAACKQAYSDVEKTTQEKMGKYNALLGGKSGLF
mgnify:CR=1 FL=1